MRWWRQSLPFESGNETRNISPVAEKVECIDWLPRVFSVFLGNQGRFKDRFSFGFQLSK